MKVVSIFFTWFFLLSFFCFTHAASLNENIVNEQYRFKGIVDLTNVENTKKLLAEHVIENHMFFGLASHYNSVGFFVVESAHLKPLQAGQTITPGNSEWFAAVGRFNVMVFKLNGAVIKIDKNAFEIKQHGNEATQTGIYIVEKPSLVLISPELNQLRYSHIWYPIAILARSIEWTLVKIHKYIADSWVLSIFVLSFFLKILLFPIGILTASLQRKVSKCKSILSPQLDAIKSKYDGEEAHKRIMVAHKSLGVSPFYTLKPIIGSFIQFPIWIATFNALGEMPQLSGASFLWINDIAYPDTIVTFSSTFPLFGDSVRVLPCLMTLITVLSANLHQDRLAPASELKRQKFHLYMMAIVFLILFYPFPASMLIYWTTNNFLHLFQQKIIKI